MPGKNIIVADDDQDVLLVLDKRLTDDGYSVTTANSPTAMITALLLGDTAPPDLIILDVDLPDMHGRVVAKKLAQNRKTKDIPILFITGLYSKPEEIERGKMLDGHMMLSKPYEPQELLGMIDTILSPAFA